MIVWRSGAIRVALASLLLLGTGCGFYLDTGLPGPNIVVGPVGPVVGPVVGPAPAYGNPYRRRHDVVRVGLTGGSYSASDAEVDSGPYVGGLLSFWPSDIFGLELGLGVCSMTDTNVMTRGDITVVPVTFNAVLSLPDAAIPFFRWRLGGGMGFASVSHSTESLSDTMALLTFHAGGEIEFAPGAHIFLIGEYMNGSIVSNANYDWDLQSIMGARVGLQFGF